MSKKPVYNTERLDQLAGDQFSMISRGQAIECGMLRSQIDYRIRDGGPWQRVLPGVYATTTGVLAVNQRDMAALLHAGPDSVLTGHAAVTRHMVRCSGSNNIDVLVPLKSRVASSGFVRVIHTGRMPEKWWTTGEIRFADIPRAVADAVRGMKDLSEVRAVVADAVQRGRCEIPLLVTELRRGPTVGSAMFHHALAEVSGGIRSSAEADLKELIDKSDLERPLYNPRLYTPEGEFLGIPDAWWQRAGVAAEVDSLQYHLSPDDYENTVLRHNRMQAAGINLLHFLPRTLRADSGTVVADLRRAIEAGRRRPPLSIIAIPVSEELTQLPESA
ncbi:MAG TPA: hypothetical protein VGG75_07585 [Trebonia sp.]|jgi:hypothetical protein